MPVKFWHTSLRFWFFLSYLITTVTHPQVWRPAILKSEFWIHMTNNVTTVLIERLNDVTITVIKKVTTVVLHYCNWKVKLCHYNNQNTCENMKWYNILLFYLISKDSLWLAQRWLGQQQTTLFSKIMPNFWRTRSHCRIFLKKFPLRMLILGQKSCI